MNVRKAYFSERLRASRCPHCGPGMGRFALEVPVLGDEQRRRVVVVSCKYCGGHSPAFREEAYS
jgi:DNA-directed RNA polymerase subunit RPC12/RpoP